MNSSTSVRRIAIGIIPHLQAATDLYQQLRMIGSPAEHYVLVSSAATDTTTALYANTPFVAMTLQDDVLIHGAVDKSTEGWQRTTTGITFESERLLNVIELINCLKTGRSEQFRMLKSRYMEYGKLVLLLMLKDSGSKEAEYCQLVLSHTVEHFQTLDL